MASCKILSKRCYWLKFLILLLVYMGLTSLVPRPVEAEEEKGPGFSRSRMRVIITNLSTCTCEAWGNDASLSYGFIADIFCLLRA